MNNHNLRKVYRALLRRLDRVQSIAWEEAWLSRCEVIGAPGWFAAERQANRLHRREAMDAVQRLLTALERSGLISRAGALAVTGVFAIACRDAAGLGDHQRRRDRYTRRLCWVWHLDQMRLALSRVMRWSGA